MKLINYLISKKNFPLIGFLLLFKFAEAQKILSPDKNIEVIVNVEKQITYDLIFKKSVISKSNAIALILEDGKVLGKNDKIIKIQQSSITNQVKPLFGMASVYEDHFNGLKFYFEDFSIEFRAYNSGVAYRFETNLPGIVKIKDELAEFNFVNVKGAWMQSGTGHGDYYESSYQFNPLDFLIENRYACLPFVVDAPIKQAVIETDLFDYPGMLLKSNEKGGVSGTFPFVVKKDSIGGTNNFNRIPYEFEDYIAETSGNRTFPWRITVIAENDKDLLYNNLEYLLARENKISDVSWIKPGLVAWDWFCANQLSGVDFKTGYNTETYQYFIDFAARNQFPYIIMDEGWSDQQDLLKLNDGSIKTNDGLNLPANLDMPYLLNYAKEKGVGIVLWCVWHTMDRQMTEALDQFEKWGVAGIKVDFMSREDQYVVNFYERLSNEAAKRKMVVDFHGAFVPKGLERAYPNVLNYEAVQGLEFNKFSSLATPDNVVLIPFIRMLAGMMDYTPGGMVNANTWDFRISMQRPMTQGTRCQQLALFTILYAPFQMLADSPTAYEKEPDILDYISKMPTIWDATHPVDGKIGEYAVLARKKDDVWYVGAINNNTQRTIKVTFDFLNPESMYAAEMFVDGANADRIGEDYKLIKKMLKNGDEVEFEMAPGGGFALKFIEIKN